MAILQNTNWLLLPNTAGPSRLNQGWWGMTLANEPSGIGGIQLRSPAFNSGGQIIRFEFEYVSWGGTGGEGISLYLFDASVPGAGTGGAPNNGLGYINLAGGYIGLGLDETGEFFSDGFYYPNGIAARGSQIDNYPSLLHASGGHLFCPGCATRQDAVDAGWATHVVAQFTPLPQGQHGYSIDLSLNTFFRNDTPIAGYHFTPSHAAPALMKVGVAATNGPTGGRNHEIRANSPKLTLTPV